MLIRPLAAVKFRGKTEGGRADNNIDFAELVSFLERLEWVTFSVGPPGCPFV